MLKAHSLGDTTGTAPPSKHWEEIYPAYTLITDLWPPAFLEIKFLLFKWYFITMATIREEEERQTSRDSCAGWGGNTLGGTT
jgi:hypothetical protein